jgi:hypothetical protein
MASYTAFREQSRYFCCTGSPLSVWRLSDIGSKLSHRSALRRRFAGSTWPRAGVLDETRHMRWESEGSTDVSRMRLGGGEAMFHLPESPGLGLAVRASEQAAAQAALLQNVEECRTNQWEAIKVLHKALETSRSLDEPTSQDFGRPSAAAKPPAPSGKTNRTGLSYLCCAPFTRLNYPVSCQISRAAFLYPCGRYSYVQ